MASYPYFQNRPDQTSHKANFPSQSLSLSVVLQYAENAKKQSFESVCRLQPLVKTYRDSVEGALQAMVQTGSTLGEEVPAAYAAAFTLVTESFKVHLGALDDWMKVLTQKNEAESEKAMVSVQQSGGQLESALTGLSSNAMGA